MPTYIHFFPNAIALWNDLAPSMQMSESLFLNAPYIPFYITLIMFLECCVCVYPLMGALQLAYCYLCILALNYAKLLLQKIYIYYDL